jgi:hypothetical protein
MAELFANNAATTLSAAITTAVATTLTVTSATAFPSTGNFRVRVDSEIMLVTGVSGTTFTITQGRGEHDGGDAPEWCGGHARVDGWRSCGRVRAGDRVSDACRAEGG